MHVRNKLPLIFILNETAEKDKKTGQFKIKPTHLQWIICYANFLSSSKLGYNIFDIDVLKEITVDRITNTLEDMQKCPLTQDTIYMRIPKVNIKTLKKAIKEYNRIKGTLDLQEWLNKISNSIISWAKKTFK